MPHAVRFYETGGPEVLKYEQVEVGDPGPGQVRVRHSYVAVNFIDIYFRIGRYPSPLPNGMGSDAVGVVEVVGPGVTEVREASASAICSARWKRSKIQVPAKRLRTRESGFRFALRKALVAAPGELRSFKRPSEFTL